MAGFERNPMTITGKDWKIKSFKYGWLTQIKHGNQWKENHYFTNLDHAATDILQQLFSKRTSDLEIGWVNQDEALEACKELSARLEQIRTEVLESIK